MNKSRGEEKAGHFTSLIFEKKKEKQSKRITNIFKEIFLYSGPKAFKNFNIIKVISKFSAPPPRPTENFLVTLVPHDKNTRIVTRILFYSLNNPINKCYFNIQSLIAM